MDGCQRFFQICVTVLTENYSPELNCGVNDSNLEADSKEKYENVELLFKLTNVDSIPFKFLSGFKLLLIVNDTQTATSCPYCFVVITELRYRQEEENEY